MIEIIQLYGWQNVPSSITSREGIQIDASTDIWHLPYVVRNNASIDFNKVIEIGIRWVTKRYVHDKLKTTSTHAGLTAFQYLQTEVFAYQNKFEVINGLDTEDLKSNLIRLFEAIISASRKSHRVWAMYRPIQWYIWCAENYPEIGFCPAYALELDAITIPGNPKGEAVRMEDADRGPLHRTMELPLLIKAMREDKSNDFGHLQEKAILALSIALGRNPANLTYLKESDLVNLTPDSTEATWVINMPRIKKRQLNPRDDLLTEYLDSEFAGYLLELIEVNKTIPTVMKVEGKNIIVDRPLFINQKGNQSAILSKLIDSAFNMTSADISEALKKFVTRHKIISPLTDEMLRLSTRRLRYTLGTALASEGVSKKELARILDHTDTQHVLVYFELAGSIVEHLDNAAAKEFSKYIQLFKGNIIDSVSDAVNGERDDKHLVFFNESNPIEQIDIGVCRESNLCHLDPPYSCYLCEKFQPLSEADHDRVLDCLSKSGDERKEKYKNSPLGIQLVDVMIAVAQVAESCRLRKNHGR